MEGFESKKKLFLPLAAGIVAVAAVLTVLLPRLQNGQSKGQGQTAAGESLVIHTTELSQEASFFDYEADDTTVELFAVEASDGTIRLALNTCQVCNGSPYAYFVQEGDYFICQNCGNYFSSVQVGVVSGGCNPIPITEEDYTVEDDDILISAELLDGYAAKFKNWKQF